MKRKILLFLLLFCSITIHTVAQKAAKVKSFTLTTDHISSSDRRKDLNGVLCALVKIQVVDNIERIEGNKIGNIINRGVEKWVYMCKGSRNMKIHLKNHLPVKVMFQNYNVNGLESNRVYEMIIEIPDAPTTSALVSTQVNETKYQKLVISYTPQTAMVLVDSKPYKGNGSIELRLPVGEHNYIIAAEGYSVSEGSIKINEQAPSFISANLVPDNPVQVAVESKKHKAKKEPKIKKIKEPKIKKIKEPKIKKIKEPKIKKKKDKKSYYAKMKSAEKTVNSEQTSTEIQNGYHAESPIHTSSESFSTIEPNPIVVPKSLNKSFKYTYEGVTFKCKAQKGYVTITEWNVNALDVTIPSKVIFEGNYYTVTTINTYINGNNYAAKTLNIQEGIKIIKNYAFAEFRNLTSVSIPSSIKEIGKNAFRNNSEIQFNVPDGIDENALRNGLNIKIK